VIKNSRAIISFRPSLFEKKIPLLKARREGAVEDARFCRDQEKVPYQVAAIIFDLKRTFGWGRRQASR
jgi:hypothetical protein